MVDCEKKQVLLVVEGTAALFDYWPTILNDYLNNLIRSYCGNGSSSEKDDAAYSPNVEFAIVVFNTCESSNSTWLLHQSNWTNDVNLLMKSLSAIDFSSDTDDADAATAQGLAQALTMFRSKSNESQNESFQRHCILVVASYPDPPPPDMEKVANLFSQSNVSLFILYPWQLPKLADICKAGKRNSSDTGVETITENVHHMSLSATSSGKPRRTLADVNYVKVWEGDLYGVIQGKRLLLTRLRAYLHSSASKLVKNWPSSIEIDFFYRTNKIESLQKKYAETSFFVVFRAMNSHEVLRKLQEHKHYGVIHLPPQKVVFTLTKDPCRFIGMILTKQVFLYKKWKGQTRI